MLLNPQLEPPPLERPLARTAICVCGQAGPLLQGPRLPVPAAMAAVVMVGGGLAGRSAVQGGVAETSHGGALGRQSGDGALHGAGVWGRLRAGTRVGARPESGVQGGPGRRGSRHDTGAGQTTGHVPSGGMGLGLYPGSWGISPDKAGCAPGGWGWGGAPLRGWGSGTTKPFPLPGLLLPTRDPPLLQKPSLHKMLFVCLSLPGRAGPRRPLGLSVPTGQGGCQEEGGYGPGWKDPGWGPQLPRRPR